MKLPADTQPASRPKAATTSPGNRITVVLSHSAGQRRDRFELVPVAGTCK
jgi:hypothetical protein